MSLLETIQVLQVGWAALATYRLVMLVKVVDISV